MIELRWIQRDKDPVTYTDFKGDEAEIPSSKEQVLQYRFKEPKQVGLYMIWSDWSKWKDVEHAEEEDGLTEMARLNQESGQYDDPFNPLTKEESDE